jgi:hypothetical protein
LAALLEHQRRKRAGSACQRVQHPGAGERVVESAVGGLGLDRLIRREPLQGVGRGARQQDRRELGGVEARQPFAEAGALEKGNVEADVVPEERGAIAEEFGETPQRLGQWWRAGEVLGPDPGQARDGRSERAAGIDESDETVGDGELAARVAREAYGPDLDDAVAFRVETGGLEVDRDEARTLRKRVQ